MAKQGHGGQSHANRGTTDSSTEDDVTDAVPTAPADTERSEKLAEDVDSMLDEIDDVLEENAEEFVRAYVQKGGQ